MEHYSFEITDHIGILRLGPPPGNELSSPAFVPPDLFRIWCEMDDLKGMIITGTGRNFSSGGALKSILQRMDFRELESDLRNGKALLQEVMCCNIPIMAAINRICFGGGLEIALACHIRVASENALLAFPEVNHGLMPGLGGTVNLPPLIGLGRAATTILGGDMINAAQALELGMVDYLAPDDGALGFSLELMRKMTNDRPRHVITSIMRALHAATCEPLEAAMETETMLFCELVRRTGNSGPSTSSGI